jgi:hypothetical protein
MLPQVNAVASVSFHNIASLEDRDGARQVVLAPLAAQSGQPVKPSPPQAETALASQRLADLLGSENIKAIDTLAKVATQLAALVGQTQKPGEGQADFTNRLANFILNMTPDALQKVETVLGFRAAGFTAYAFAAALKNPGSALAARLVALIETPMRDGMQQAIKTAISNYQQMDDSRANLQANPTGNSKASAGDRPAATAGQDANAQDAATDLAERAAPSGQHAAQTGASAKTLPNTLTEAGANKQAGNQLGNHADNQALKASPSALSAEQSATAGLIADQNIAASESQLPQQHAATDITPQSETAATGERGNGDEQAALAESKQGRESTKAQPSEASQTEKVAARGANGQHAMQVLRSLVATVSEALEQAVATAAVAPDNAALAGSTASEKDIKAPKAVVEPSAMALSEQETTEDVAQKARQTMRALEGKVIPLFASPSSGKPVEDADVERILQQANLPAASQARAAAGAEAAAQVLMAKLPDPIPFAQIPFPPAREEEKRKHGAGYKGEQGEGAFDDQNGDQESAMQNDNDNEQQAAEPEEIEDKPFDAETPLHRNATDAERAFHMYQRFGGF